MTELEKLTATFTEEFLKQSSVKKLKEKMDQIDNIAAQHTKLWDETNWDDQPEEETIGYEGMREKMIEKRDAAKKVLSDRIQEKEAEEARGKAAGTIVAQGETMKELKKIMTKLNDEKGKLTDEYFQSTEKAGLDAKKTELQALQASYMAKHATLKLNLLLPQE